MVNNGWDLRGCWPKSFHAAVLKCGLGPFALAQATRRSSAAVGGNEGCRHAVTGLRQHSVGLKRSHTHTHTYQTDVKQKSREREIDGEIKEGGEREERITCSSNRSIGSVFR